MHYFTNPKMSLELYLGLTQVYFYFIFCIWKLNVRKKGWGEHPRKAKLLAIDIKQNQKKYLQLLMLQQTWATTNNRLLQCTTKWSLMGFTMSKAATLIFYVRLDCNMLIRTIWSIGSNILKMICTSIV